jgi:hypothetical protein
VRAADVRSAHLQQKRFGLDLNREQEAEIASHDETRRFYGVGGKLR